MLKDLASKMGILPGDLRRLIYTRARQQGVQVIARSSQQDRRDANRRDITHDSLPAARCPLPAARCPLPTRNSTTLRVITQAVCSGLSTRIC